jgi:hypothetical protein
VISTEDEASQMGETEMIAGMSRCMERCHFHDRIAIPQQNIRREGGIGAQIKGESSRAGACFQGSGRAEMISMCESQDLTCQTVLDQIALFMR